MGDNTNDSSATTEKKIVETRIYTVIRVSEGNTVKNYLKGVSIQIEKFNPEEISDIETSLTAKIIEVDKNCSSRTNADADEGDANTTSINKDIDKDINADNNTAAAANNDKAAADAANNDKAAAAASTTTSIAESKQNHRASHRHLRHLLPIRPLRGN